MFSPASRRSPLLRQKDRIRLDNASLAPSASSPSTPQLQEQSVLPLLSPSFHNRPATGTPAPWVTRPSVAVRFPTRKNYEKGTDLDQTNPVDVGDFPSVLRDAQSELLQKGAYGDKLFTGGMDRGTGLCWMICRNKLYIWSYLSAALSNKCVTVEIPSMVFEIAGGGTKGRGANLWMVCLVKWDAASANSDNALGQCNSAGVVVCNMKTHGLAYWPDIFSENGSKPVVSLPSSFGADEIIFQGEVTKDDKRDQENILAGSSYFSDHVQINSIIAAPVTGSSDECIAIACQSSGKLWHFHFTPTGIYRKRVPDDIFGASYVSHPQANRRYARSLIWHLLPSQCSEKSDHRFFLLTDCEVQCWNAILTPVVDVRKLWSHEIISSDADLGIKKDLAGQKRIWLLDMQVDSRGKELTILVATFCKDRLGGSSYTQYSLLTMLYKDAKNLTIENPGAISARFLEKKAPLQIIIPKARVEDEDFLFSMRLRVGGKPPGSAIVLSGDGTATVTHYMRGCTRLYQFDLPYDAGKVLDASVFPSAEDDEEGAWIVLTEKVGVWAIPEKAVLLGGVEPPERSLSRKGSCNEGVAQEEKRIQAFVGNMAPRRASSEAWGSGDRPRPVITSMVQRAVQDEEADALLGHLFHGFMLSGESDGAFEKLRVKGAFEKEGETNVFARFSKSIVDTLAKHWTTTRGQELVASTIVSSLLSDKQQKHQKYLQFLALSKCHEELSSKQKNALLCIMEHGEKLASIVQLRVLQCMISQSHSGYAETQLSHSEVRMNGSLWDLIQLVGERARRNTIMLMDRDNAEVFYSKVSDVDEFFYCLSHHINYLIGDNQPYTIQVQRACELSNACSVLIQGTMQYRMNNQAWYPSPEGLMPWNYHLVVRSGLWSVASCIMQLLKEAAIVDISKKSDLWPQLEVLTNILLEVYTGSIVTKMERQEEHGGLVQEYSRRRDELLDSLFTYSKRFADAKYEDKYKGVEDFEAKEGIYREVYTPILAIAKRHEGYQTLWRICYQLNDSGLLRSLMHDSCGPKGGFSKFVFDQLIKNHQYAKLLKLGEEFQEELACFLKDKIDLRWLHEIFLSQFSSASETLHSLALYQDDSSALIEKLEFPKLQMRSSLADRRRLLNLSKIAAAAGKEIGFELEKRRIDADLRILKLQEEVLASYSETEENLDVNKLIPPEELIEMCLRGENRELALLAFQIFAWTSSSFRSSNRSLLEECWRNAVDHDDWVALAGASRTAGWSEEMALDHLRESILFQASYLCYGPEVDTYGGRFDEVLPLMKDDVDFTSLRDSGSSVEAILMQHKNFSDAGKLMLTAITLGKEGIGVIAEAEGELAMES